MGALSHVCQTAGIIECGAARWTVSTLNCDEDCVAIAVVSHHGAQCMIFIFSEVKGAQLCFHNSCM